MSIDQINEDLKSFQPVSLRGGVKHNRPTADKRLKNIDDARDELLDLVLQAPKKSWQEGW